MTDVPAMLRSSRLWLEGAASASSGSRLKNVTRRVRRAADECVPNQPERVSVRFPTKPWANAQRLMWVGKFSSADRLSEGFESLFSLVFVLAYASGYTGTVFQRAATPDRSPAGGRRCPGTTQTPSGSAQKSCRGMLPRRALVRWAGVGSGLPRPKRPCDRRRARESAKS